ncbi:MAG: hypothetical protein II670_01270, partial [Alphaproteobacteria bacterium]|nr:hypothetical protein [Alphaproteobacteria bacterium]
MIKKLLSAVFVIIMMSFWGILLATDITIHNNKAVPKSASLSFCKTSDTEAPTISMNGDKEITLKIGSE